MKDHPLLATTWKSETLAPSQKQQRLGRTRHRKHGVHSSSPVFTAASTAVAIPQAPAVYNAWDSGLFRKHAHISASTPLQQLSATVVYERALHVPGSHRDQKGLTTGSPRFYNRYHVHPTTNAARLSFLLIPVRAPQNRATETVSRSQVHTATGICETIGTIRARSQGSLDTNGRTKW